MRKVYGFSLIFCSLVAPASAADPLECLEDCNRQGDEVFSACMESGGAPEQCAQRAFEAASVCVDGCDLGEPFPPLDPCFADCESRATETFSQCVADGTAEEECAQRADAAFGACLEGCDPGFPPGELPEEIVCAEACLNRVFESCLDENGEPDIDCLVEREDEALACFASCGVDVPEPDPCVSGCEEAAARASEECVDDDGNLDFECLARIDAQFIACLGECGIEVPDIPPIDPETAECAFGCDESFFEATDACVDENGEMDFDCFAAADEAYLACLTGCGIELPDVDAEPAQDCLFRCEDEFAALVDTCMGDDGEIDVECLEELSGRVEECVAACEEAGDNRVIAAAIQAESRPTFVRGDSNHDHVVDVTDALVLVNYLFLGSEPVACPDAADANDSGNLNLTDAIALLNHLFLGSGPLPAPSQSPGVDPTPDAIDCR